MKRRTALYSGVAGLAAATGAGMALWRTRIGAEAPGTADALWSLSFPTPAGQTLTMASLKGRPLLLNFWATWCPPCVEEMPLLDGFYKQHASNGWQLLGLAVDQADAVRKFLARTPVHYPIALAGLGGTDLGKALGNLSGGLPFTVVFGADGEVRQRRMGQVTEAELRAWAGTA